MGEEPTACPFVLTGVPRTGAWLTPGCVLRWTDRLYYYPCLCNECSAPVSATPGVSLSVNDVVQPDCKISFDPRTFAYPYKQTSSVFWPTDYTEETDQLMRTALSAKVSHLHTLRQRQHTGVDIERLLNTYVTGADAVVGAAPFGNTEVQPQHPEPDASTTHDAPTTSDAPPSTSPNTPPYAQAWFSSEGLAGEEAGTRFCDLIHDWWPEKWEQPVGVHVTTPCHSSETAYRGFDSAFTINRTSEDNPRMVYQHEAIRDRSLTSDNFGVSGLCRMRSVGLPVQEMNTMRFCTRMDVLASSDPAMPLRANTPHTAVTDNRYVESCAPHSSGVPWDARELEGKHWEKTVKPTQGSTRPQIRWVTLYCEHTRELLASCSAGRSRWELVPRRPTFGRP